jgi:translation initiation factor IF-2
MDDRVRIYELARRMNIQNQDIITTLRELGYDIKSHSSTVDANAVGLLIAALGKKKQQEKAKPVKAPSGKSVSKAAPPPTPVVVKPRVLSRYRPVPVAAPGTEPAAEAVPGAVPAQPVVLPVPGTIVSPGMLAPAAARTGAPVPGAAPASISPPAETTPGADKGKHAVVDESHEVTPPAQKALRSVGQKDVAHPAEEAHALHPASAPASAPSQSEAAPAVAEEQQDFSPPEEEGPPESPEAIRFAPPTSRPSAPPVPIRIAAPSIRATPPRPPKAHRQAPAERHLQKKEEKLRPTAVAVEVPKVVTITSALSVKELADKMSVPDTEVIKRLFMKGHMRNINQLVELELARALATEMEYEVLTEAVEEATIEEPTEEVLSDEDRAALVHRPPVVTIMGHVDHGKTSLLDAIRQTKFLLTDAESGGITQHIGAYHVEVPHEDGTLRQIVFLDTPGHEAFTAMRARGAKVTDIAILVVAADDGVMPQTIEAIDHAKAAGVPIIVAVNKIDKQEADPDRVLTQLMEHGLVPEDFGGETVTVKVSAKKRQNLDLLLEMILLVAEMQDLRANPDRPAEGVIIEAELSRGKGAVATALVENGTLREGDFIVAGSKSGRVRALFDDRGQRVKAAGPSMPVEVLGLDEVPQAGDTFEVVEDGQAAKTLVEQRKNSESDRRGYHVTLESLHDLLSKGEVKELSVIIKADVQGTAEAIAESVKKLSALEVAVRVLRTASGDISENDVNLAASSNAIIIGFKTQPDQNAARVAETAGVDIRTYDVIYQITDDLLKAMQGLIEPLRQEVQIGTAEVRQIFKVGKNLMIAGCMVTSGKVQRGGLARIEREGQIIYEGKIETLKRFKDDAREVAQGFECGMSFEKFNELTEGDKINVFVVQESKRDLTRA